MSANNRKKHMVICLDFDGTVTTHRYPEIGHDIGALPWLRIAQKLGAKIVLFTMRDGDELEAARRYLEGEGVSLFGVNVNPQQRSWTKSPKAYGHLFIDDNALGVPLRQGDGKPFVDWDRAGPMMIESICDWIIRHEDIGS